MGSQDKVQGTEKGSKGQRGGGGGGKESVLPS